MRKTLVSIVSSFVLCVPAGVGSAADPSDELARLLDDHVEWHMRENPLSASQRGDLRYNHLLRDESPAAYARRLQDVRDRLGRVRALDRSGFDEEALLNADLLEYELSRRVRSAHLFNEQLPINQRSGPQVWLPQMGDQLPFLEPAHYVDYIQRLEAIPRQIDQMIEQMRRGLAAGRVPPRVVVVGTDDQAFGLANEAVRRNPRSSRFFMALRGGDLDEATLGRAERAIENGVIGAFDKLGTFLRDEYIPRARDTVGISQGVDGEEAYRIALQRHTTTDLSPEEVHAIGLSEVARIRGEMIEVIARTDFPQRDDYEGDELLERFFEYLRTEPRFYHETPEDLLEGYRDICKRMDAELPQLFGLLPRLPYGVRELPAFAAPTAPTAYYYRGSIENAVPGYFIANTYRLDQRPKYEMVALALHEAVPGHHLQIALSQELEGVHPFRTIVSYTGFVEGWALYAERLGLEVGDDPERGGFYEDPYDDFGRLTYEMWRACRLVVDTGLHAKGWSREDAVEFMRGNSALAEHNILREIDRYIAWPGQACAYKIGELTIRRLRAMAEDRLGSRFDVRAFHDAVLGAGALPLPTLERRIERWVSRLEREGVE